MRFSRRCLNLIRISISLLLCLWLIKSAMQGCHQSECSEIIHLKHTDGMLSALHRSKSTVGENVSLMKSILWLSIATGMLDRWTYRLIEAITKPNTRSTRRWVQRLRGANDTKGMQTISWLDTLLIVVMIGSLISSPSVFPKEFSNFDDAVVFPMEEIVVVTWSCGHMQPFITDVNVYAGCDQLTIFIPISLLMEYPWVGKLRCSPSSKLSYCLYSYEVIFIFL